MSTVTQLSPILAVTGALVVVALLALLLWWWLRPVTWRDHQRRERPGCGSVARGLWELLQLLIWW
ncbi:MAG: hypothetical protein ACK47B_19385 [Armatimonadota bacterium]